MYGSDAVETVATNEKNNKDNNKNNININRIELLKSNVNWNCIGVNMNYSTIQQIELELFQHSTTLMFEIET